MRIHLLAVGTAVLGATLTTAPGCKTTTQVTEGGTPGSAPVARPCPDEAPPLPLLPVARPRHEVVDFWLARGPDPDQPLLTPEQIAAHNARVAELTHKGWPSGRWDLLTRPLDQQAIAGRFRQQLDWLRGAIEQGKRVLADGRPAWPLYRQLAGALKEGATEPVDEIRVARRGTPIRCYPTERPIYDEPWSLAFDLMQCSQLRLGEPVRVVRKGPEMWLIWTSYTEGWVDPAALSAPLPAAQAEAYLRPERLVVVLRDRLPLRDAASGELVALPRLGLQLPLLAEDGARMQLPLPAASGLRPVWIARAPQLHLGRPALTRRNLLSIALATIDARYGWGGTGGLRDCSRLLMDLFGVFGLQLPRNSAQQANAGIEAIDVDELDDVAKAAAIERAHQRGLLLLYLPGHIMLYLGRDGAHHFAFHLLSGYLVPCPGGGETMFRVNRALVTSLELGRGSSRRAFIERITRLVIIGPPSPENPATRPSP